MSERRIADRQAGGPRVRLLKIFFSVALLGLAGRLIDLALEERGLVPAEAAPVVSDIWTGGGRVDIVDRNGVLLATDYPKVSLFADPSEVLDPARAGQRLAAVLADGDEAVLVEKLSRPTRFVWLKRHIAESEQRAVMRLGLPGIKLRNERHRIYPHGPLVAHLLGFVGIDNQGLAGLERSLEARIRQPAMGSAPLRLTIDVRVQEIV
ncbi:MAG: penicillin-binding protein 2, partial [Geminicoccaceae bacterium]|nr:penicillin-binding protein 2 [Geminicoccaceae bacterium]